VRCSQEVVLKETLAPNICKGGAPSAVCLRARCADCSISVPVLVLVAFIAKELRGRNRRAGGKGGASRAPRIASARMRSGKQGVQPAERGGLAHATRARRCRALDEHARGMRSITALSRLQAWGNRAPLTGATGLLCECLIATWVVGNGVRKSAHAAQRKAGQTDRRRCCACKSKLTAAEATPPRTPRSARRPRAGRRETDRGTASCQMGAHPSFLPARFCGPTPLLWTHPACSWPPSNFVMVNSG
jgi:hypothetical protein